MLRITIPANSAAAKAYYSKAGDYYGYGQGGEYAGQWQGKLAHELGLSGAATMEDFHALCENRHPRTGERLTGCDREDRRPLIDFTWSVPKSVALMRSLVGDERIEQAIWDTVTQTMGDIESEIAARVRKNGAYHNRIVGNGVILPFYHRYSRPVGGEADPGDHIHSCLLNVCRDPVEDQLKAVEIGHIKKKRPAMASRVARAAGQSAARTGLRHPVNQGCF
jgi:conjugative relaxase-like TrwC/TraI family protein